MRTALFLAFFLLTACSDERPPAPTAEEAAQLDDAEALLNREAAKEKGPEDRSPGPSERSD